MDKKKGKFVHLVSWKRERKKSNKTFTKETSPLYQIAEDNFKKEKELSSTVQIMQTQSRGTK